MKKRILFYLILVLIGFKSYGQTVLLTEGWENTTNNSYIPPPGWGIGAMGYVFEAYYMSTGTYPTVSPFEGARLVDFKSHSTTTGTTNILFRAYPISSVGYSNITVDFEWYTDNGYPTCTNEGVTVQWSTDGNTWVSAGSLWPRYSPINQWVLNTQALPPAAAGISNLYIGFLFLSQNGNDCHMDIIHVNGTPATGLPTVTTNVATAILSGSAMLNGTVNANGDLTTVSFDYGLTTAYGNNVAGVPSQVSGINNTTVSTNTTGLQCGTQYHFRVKGTNSSGTAYGGDLTFTTLSGSPIAVTTTPTNITISAATLNGTVNPECSNATTVFNWGLTTAYGNTVPGVPSTVSGNSAVAVSANISGLTSTQTYHYQICAVNTNGNNCGTDMSFTTQCPSAGPAGPITGPIQFCQGQCGYVYSVSTIINAIGYIWTLPAGGMIIGGANTNTITVCYASNAVTGNVSVYGTSACGNGSTSQLVVTMNPPASPSVSGPVSVCVNSGGNIYTTQSGMSNYIWTITGGGIIIAGGTTTDNTITVTWNTSGGKAVCVNYNTTAGCTAPSPACYNVNVNSLPTPTINGPNQVCMNTPCSVYTTQAGMTNYQWSVSVGGTIVSGVGTNSICVLWNSLGSQSISINYTNTYGCTAVAPFVYAVIVNPLPIPTITGPISVCALSTGNTYTTQAGMTNYIWSVSSGGTVTSGGTSTSNTVTVTWNTAGSQTVSVNYTNSNGCTALAPTVYNITVNALSTPTISGPTLICVNSTNNVYTTQAGMTNYVWSVSSGGIITSGGSSANNTVTITWMTAGTQSVSVNYINSNGCSAFTPTIYPIFVNALPVPVITGPSTVCVGSSGNVYTTQSGMANYIWNVSPGGNITAGGTTTSNTVTVTWNSAGTQTVSVNYTNANNCTGSTSTVNNVTVNPLPVPTITGQTSTCVNSGYYNYSTEANMTNYIWTVSSGGIINYGSGTNQVQVSWIISGPQTLSVTYTTTAGCNPLMPTVLNVTVNPLPGVSGFITGNANVCAGANGVTYSVFPIPNTITYVWALPPNATIASGAGTNSITVNFAANASSGDIVVWGNNNCGDGQNSPPFSVSVTQLPVAAGNITGPDSVCQESTGKVYTVPLIYGASGYNWTLPQGATTGSGSNSNSIMVDFSNSAVSGDITVSGSNSCGSGTVSPNFFVTVNPIPPTPVVTNLGTTLQSNAPTGNQWFFEGTLITGATFQNYIATQNGFYWDIVTLHGCSSDTSNHKLILVTGVENHSSPAILVFPVPNDGWFNVSITTASEESFSIRVYNYLGVNIYEGANVEVTGSLQKVIDLRPVPSGVYTVTFKNSNNTVVKKIIVNK